MGHGYPDWAQSAGVSTIYQLRDLAELAARLGSIDTFDRRGDVVYLEDFESDIATANIGYSGTGGGAYLSLAHKKSGRFSLCLKAGSDDSQFGFYYANAGVLAPSKLGLEVSFTLKVDMTSLDCLVLFYTGLIYIKGHIRLNFVTGKIELLNDALGWDIIDSLPVIYRNPNYFYTLKLVLDMSSMKYTRLLLWGKSYDLSSYGCYNINSAVAGNTFIQIYNTGLVGKNPIIYIDNVILTQNEP